MAIKVITQLRECGCEGRAEEHLYPDHLSRRGW